MRYLLLMCAFMLSGCVMIPVGNTSSSDSSEAFMKYLETREKKETPPMLSMDSATILAMSPAQLEAFMRGIGEMQRDIPQNIDKSSTNTVNEAKTTHETSQKESILITALGLGVLLIVVVLGVAWFKRTVAGKVLSSGAEAVGGYLQGQIESVRDKMRISTDPDEIKRYQEEAARLLQDIINNKN